jgi:hypothetical protein
MLYIVLGGSLISSARRQKIFVAHGLPDQKFCGTMFFELMEWFPFIGIRAHVRVTGRGLACHAPQSSFPYPKRVQ